MKCSTAFAEVKTTQSNVLTVAQASSSGPSSVTGSMRMVGASIGSAPRSRRRSHQLRSLPLRPRHEHPLPEQRARVEPAQVLAESDDGADDQDTRAAALRVPHDGLDLLQRAVDGALGGQGAVEDERSRFIGRPAVGQQLVDDDLELRASTVADDGARQGLDRLPVDVRGHVRLGRMPRMKTRASRPPDR